jgi:peroxiredoxin
LPLVAPRLDAQQKIVWSEREKPIMDTMRTLRSLGDEDRARTTRRLALEIRELPVDTHREMLAVGLASLVTEGDPGRETLQEVATTLAETLRQAKPAAPPAPPADDQAYVTLARLVRYEQVNATLDDPRFRAAMAKLEADDQARQTADFTLADLNGKKWSLRELRGSVVLVNFWATWCPPCRKEMPDLEALYRRFAAKGLVILAISDEDAGKVQPFIAERRFTYPILLDPGRKVNETMRIEGIPQSYVYDRSGRMVAEAMDMRTQRQFLEMLAKAGLVQ